MTQGDSTKLVAANVVLAKIDDLKTVGGLFAS